jgi:hypothetical protein
VDGFFHRVLCRKFRPVVGQSNQCRPFVYRIADKLNDPFCGQRVDQNLDVLA